ncbi:MAG: RluA family pseudouridine synthase [Planctomycetota bacterium]
MSHAAGRPVGVGGNSMKRDGSHVFHILAEEAQTTLAALLRRRLPELSWSQARKLIHGRRVQIHGNLCVDEGRRLKEGEVVKVLAQSQALPPRDDDVRIRYVDAHVVVVEKPAGMTTLRHREERQWADHRKQRQPTLDEALARVLAKRAAGSSSSGRFSSENRSRGARGASEPQGRVARSGRPDRADAERRPIVVPVRPVHRLDRETSGLMVFARTVPAERSLVQQFRRHSIHRAYVAIAHGTVEAATIVSRLVRDRGDGRRGSTKLPEVGQRSVTHVRPLEKLGGYTLVACRLETGRTHQIRIHLAESGHFVCGDKVYCQPLFQKTLEDRSGAPRCALHATELGFTHPITGERLRFEMPLPADLQQLLDKLRKAAGSSATGSPTVPADGWPASLERLALAGPAVDDDESFDDEDGDGAEIDEPNGPEFAPGRQPATRQSDDRIPDGRQFGGRPRGETPFVDRSRQDRSRGKRTGDDRSRGERSPGKRPQGERPAGGGRPTGGRRARRRSKDR